MATVGVEVYVDGAWTDLAAAGIVLADQEITVRRGDGGLSSAPTPATAAARLDNTDDLLRPTNPESVLYASSGVGTPIRISRDGDVRGHLQASRWAVDETADFRPHPKRGRAWVDVDAAGLLQQAVSSPRLDSPIIRDTLPLDFLIDFWPCEDESGATRLSNLVAGGRTGRWSGGDLTLASDDRPGGAARTVVTPSGVQVSAGFQSNAGDGTGWTAVFAAKLPATMSGTYGEFFSWFDSVGRRWVWEVNDTNYRLQVYDADGATLETKVGTHTASVAQWVRYRITASASGGTVSYETEWWPEGGVGNGGMIDSFSGSSVGTLRGWNRPAATYTVDAGLCSVYGVASTVVEGQVLSAFEGHRGEEAAWRFARLMTELGYAYSVIGDESSSMPMGAQPADTVAEILREIRDTEDGLIFDSRTGLEIVMMTRGARYNQTAVSIDVTELPARPREVTADDFANIVTASQRGGGEAVASDLTGPLGVTAKGPYERQVDVSVYPERLLDAVANWQLRRATVNQPRYPSVEINLFALARSRALELAALDVGDVIEITGYRADPIRLHIREAVERIGWPNAWRLTLTCEPDDVFAQIGVYSESRYDSGSTTLATAVEVGVTSLPLTTSLLGDRWSTTAVPYTLQVAGERMVCTAMSAASGSGPWTQTATVVRSLRKRLPAGSEVHLADPARYALSGD